MKPRPTALLVAAGTTLVVVAAVLAGIATAGPTDKQTQRISISFQHKSGTFVLSPQTPGAVHRDSGTYTSCCWTRRIRTRDGQSIEIDDPTVTFTGKRGTFAWHERITYVGINNDYTVATATWKITHGTGAYAQLHGHGREAAVNRTREDTEVAAKAEGLFYLGR